MEDVTDSVFRRMICECGRPDLMFTEFIHTDRILRPSRRSRALAEIRGWSDARLYFQPEERPLVAQIWGTDPEAFAAASRRLASAGFDGIDINMGCPARKIRKKGACSGLIASPTRAAELIDAARSGGLPVSVKTRIGLSQSAVEPWIGFLIEQRPRALTIHGRTADAESEGPVDWSSIAEAVKLRDAHQTDGEAEKARTLILGNGDIGSREEIIRRCEQTGADGMMIGRGVFADPYLFDKDGPAGRFADLDRSERLRLLERHLELFEATWGPYKHYEILKRFYKIYLCGFDGAGELREALNETHDYRHARSVLSRGRLSNETVTVWP